jgi:hypothetical protein
MRPRRTDNRSGPKAASQISQARPALATSHFSGVGSGWFRQRDGKADRSDSNWKDARRVVRTWYSMSGFGSANIERAGSALAGERPADLNFRRMLGGPTDNSVAQERWGYWWSPLSSEYWRSSRLVVSSHLIQRGCAPIAFQCLPTKLYEKCTRMYNRPSLDVAKKILRCIERRLPIEPFE